MARCIQHGGDEWSSEATPLLARKTGQQSSFVTVLALWNTMIGTSVLCLPWAIKESGLLLGVLLLLVMAAVMGYTCWLVLKSVHNLADGQLLEFHDVCGLYLGPRAKLLALTGSLLTLLCGMIVYWILLTNFLFHIGNFAHERLHEAKDKSCNGSQHFSDAVCRAENMTFTQCSPERNGTQIHGRFEHWWSETSSLPLYLVPLLFPLLNFKSAVIFAKMNSVGMCSLVYLVVFVAAKAVTWGVNLDVETALPDSDLYNSHYGPQFRLTFPALTGVAALGFFVQNSVLSLVRNHKHPEHKARDLVLAYVLVAATYVYVGGVFYVTFPFNKNCITDNLLNNIASNDVLALVARAALFFQLTCIYPQLAYIVRIQLFSVLFASSWPSVFYVLVLNVFLVTICVLFAMFMPHVGRILSFVGALCGFYYAIGLPCVVRCVLLKQERRLTNFQVVFHVLLVTLGLANFVAQFFVMDHT